MSEKLNRIAPPSVQDSTHKEGINLPDFNISIQVDVFLTADPALQAALDKIADVIQEPVLEKQETIVKPTEPVRKKLDMRVLNGWMTKKSRRSQKQFSWQRFSDSKYLKYCEKDGKLFLSYAGSVVETTWDEVERIVNLRPVTKWREEVTKLVGKKASTQRRSAVNMFLKRVATGKVCREADPTEELEKNFAKFEAEEDPDAAFRPMLTSYSTRPDPNCGKVEGTLEA